MGRKFSNSWSITKEAKSNLSGIRGGAKLHKRYDLIVLDDFEGIEKGVLNYLNLVNNAIISRNSHRLIDPIKSEVLNKFNLIENSSTAIILPMQYINFSNQ